MQFEWDNKKDQINVAKHGIDFATATEVFNDSNKFVVFNRFVNGEIRFQVIGQIKNIIVIMVVFTARGGKNRIISARIANKEERSQYHAQND